MRWLSYDRRIACAESEAHVLHAARWWLVRCIVLDPFLDGCFGSESQTDTRFRRQIAGHRIWVGVGNYLPEGIEGSVD